MASTPHVEVSYCELCFGHKISEQTLKNDKYFLGFKLSTAVRENKKNQIIKRAPVMRYQVKLYCLSEIRKLRSLNVKNYQVNLVLSISLITGWTVYTEKYKARGPYEGPRDLYFSYRQSNQLLLLFTNWVQGPYEEIQAQGFSYSPSLRYFLVRHEHPVSK